MADLDTAFFDALTNMSILEKDFSPSDKDYESLPSYEIKEEKADLFQLGLADLEEQINTDKLSNLFNILEEKENEGVVTDKEVLFDEELFNSVKQVTERIYAKEEDYIRDVLFFQTIRNDALAKGVLTSEKINALFKAYHDFYQDDMQAGSIFVDDFSRKLRDLANRLGTDDWDSVDNIELMKGLGQSYNQFFKILDNPLYPNNYPKYNDEELSKGKEVKAFNKLKADLESGEKEQFLEDEAEVRKGNLDVKKEEENVNK